MESPTLTDAPQQQPRPCGQQPVDEPASGPQSTVSLIPEQHLPVRLGLNPSAAAAVAALSQLTELAGKMSAEECAMACGSHYPLPLLGPAPIGRGVGGGSSYRGGRPSSRGGGRGSLPFQGRGRGAHMGRGRGRRLHQSTSETQTSQPASASGEAFITAPGPLPPPIPKIFWCDICRVDCNSSEILEKHKAGKRHKKTVQKLEEIQAKQKEIAEYEAKFNLDRFQQAKDQSNLAIESQAEVNEQPEIVIQGKESLGSQKRKDMMQDAPSMNENNLEADQQNQAIGQPYEGQVKAATNGQQTEASLLRSDGNESAHPLKRKMAGFDRGGKRVRNLEPMHKMPPLRPREQPIVCSFCNVTCDTHAVFQCHLAGKKHIKKFKPFQGHEAMYGPLGYYPSNQPSDYSSQGLHPLLFGFQPPEMVQQIAHAYPMETSFSHQPGHGEQALHAIHAAQHSEPKGEVLETECQHTEATEPLGQPTVSNAGAIEASQTPSVHGNTCASFTSAEIAVPVSESQTVSVVPDSNVVKETEGQPVAVTESLGQHVLDAGVKQASQTPAVHVNPCTSFTAAENAVSVSESQAVSVGPAASNEGTEPL